MLCYVFQLLDCVHVVHLLVWGYPFLLLTAVAFMSRKKHEARPHKFPQRRSLTTPCRATCMPTAPLNATISHRLNPAIHPSIHSAIIAHFIFSRWGDGLFWSEPWNGRWCRVFSIRIVSQFSKRSHWSGKSFLLFVWTTGGVSAELSPHLLWKLKSTCLLQSVSDGERNEVNDHFVRFQWEDCVQVSTSGWKCLWFGNRYYYTAALNYNKALL